MSIPLPPNTWTTELIEPMIVVVKIPVPDANRIYTFIHNWPVNMPASVAQFVAGHITATQLIARLDLGADLKNLAYVLQHPDKP